MPFGQSGRRLGEIGGEGIGYEALHVVGKAVELLQVALGRGGQARAAAVVAADLRLHQLPAQARLHLVDLLPGNTIGNIHPFGRGADGAAGSDGAQQVGPPEGEDDLAVDLEPEVVAGLQDLSSIQCSCRANPSANKEVTRAFMLTPSCFARIANRACKLRGTRCTNLPL